MQARASQTHRIQWPLLAGQSLEPHVEEGVEVVSQVGARLIRLRQPVEHLETEGVGPKAFPVGLQRLVGMRVHLKLKTLPVEHARQVAARADEKHSLCVVSNDEQSCRTCRLLVLPS